MLKKIIQQSRLALFFLITFTLFSTSVKAQDSLNFLERDFTTESIRPYDMGIIDLDNDGDNDIVSINETQTPFEGKITWFENINNGEYFEYHVIFTGVIFSQFELSDLDNDGDIDIVVVSDNSLGIGWFVNDGNQNFTYSLITPTISSVKSLIVKDYNQNGFKDVLVYSEPFSNNYIHWLENDGTQNFTSQIIDSTRTYNKIIAEDLDLDGDLDILGVDNGRVDWYKNDGSQNHVYQSIQTFPSSINSKNIVLFDYDNDMDLDILYHRTNRLHCLINDGQNNFSDTIISNTPLENFITIDYDMDGDLDILGKEPYESYLVVLQQTTPQNFVLDSLNGINTVANNFTIGDLNNDNTIDIVLSYQSLYEITAFISDNHFNYNGVNLCGNFGLFSQQIDFDLDGDLDIITSDFVWHENLFNGKFRHRKLPLLPYLIQYPSNTELITSDIDNDGDYDFLSKTGSYNSGIFYWHEQDSIHNYSNHELNITNDLRQLKIIDLDQDGDNDIIGQSGYSTPFYLICSKNDGAQNFTDSIIYTSFQYGKYSIKDLDQDGDLDIIIADSESLRWLENDGNLNFTANLIESSTSGIRKIECIDKNNDGDLDIFVSYDNNDFKYFDNDGIQNFTLTTSNFSANFHLYDFDQNGIKDLLLAYSSTNKRVEILLDSAAYFATTSLTIPNFSSRIIGDFDNDNDIDFIGLEGSDIHFSYYENLDINNYLHLEYAPFIDNNSNNVLDSNEYTTDNIELIIQPNNIIQGAGVTNNHLYLDIAQDFDITLNLDTNLWIPTDSFNRHISIDSIQPIDSTIYIGYRNKHSVLTSTDITGQWPRCNDTISHQIKVSNFGNMLDTGYIQYNLDSLSEFVSASPSPDSVNGNQLFFGFNDLQTAQDKIVNVNIKLPLSIDTLEHELFTKADTGLNLIELINTKDFEELVRCSYDPNDKQVFPYYGDSGYVLPNTSLEYLIRFQNTGNDTAFIVNILDTLDTSLDLSSFELVSYSHPIQFTIQPDSREISFLFEDINLTDTITDEPGSHGFVKYRIKTEDTIVVNTEITNEAYIYFDENPPIITNSTSNLIYDCNNLGQHIAINNNEFYLLAGIPLQVDLNESFINSAQWTLDGTNISSDLTSLTQQLTTPGIHNLNIRLTNDLCSVDTTIQINVFDNVGYAELNSILKVYPNPVNNQLFIEFDQFYQNINIDIINQLGQKIDHFNFSDSKIIIPFYYEPGMYFLEITNDNQNLQRIKVVKK